MSTNYKTNNIDLTNIFQPLSTTNASITGYKSGGVDMNTLFEAYTAGQQADSTNITPLKISHKVPWHSHCPPFGGMKSSRVYTFSHILYENV
jgi:hypothetical protein